MNDKILLKISIIAAVFGLCTIIILGNVISLEESDISKLDKNSIEKNVKIKGIVNSVNSLGGIKLIEIQDNTGKIDVVVFSKNIYAKKGSIAEIEGKLTIREGKLQVNAETIKVFG
ncbi:MAG TPA: OB-fold nucleic acid binding domain-containing protein [Candidatus Nanoarchaeia archaeon]|nr:OB-fold nucleic acid binding domain-containing protein [Candidatus Nanoarchaeia archaeon]